MAPSRNFIKSFCGGGMYVADGVTAQTVATGTTYAKMTGFASNGASGGAVTPDHTNDQFTISRAGIYHVQFSFSGTLGTNNVTIRIAPFYTPSGGSATEMANAHGATKFGTAGDMQSTSGGGFLTLTDSQVPCLVDLRVRHSDGGNVDVTPVYMNATITCHGDAT